MRMAIYGHLWASEALCGHDRGHGDRRSRLAQEIAVALIGLGCAVVGGGLTSFTQWFVARGERTKFAQEKLWDDRRIAYSAIIASLVRATRHAANIQRRYQDDPHGFDASAEMPKMVAEFGKAFVEANDVFESNTLVLSAPFYRRFQAFLKQYADEVENQNLMAPEQAGICYSVLDQSTKSLRALAEVEIDPLTGR